MAIPGISRICAAVSCTACLAAAPAAAQNHITFANIPYGTPADSVRTLLEARGFRHVRTYETGELRFRSAGDVVAVAMIGSGRLVGTAVWEPAADPEARLRAVVDSLRQALGPPVDSMDGFRAWARGRSAVLVGIRPEQPGGEPRLARVYHGPGIYDEAARRGAASGESNLPAPGPEWTVLGFNPRGARLAIDTTSISRSGAGVYRARVRIDEPEPVPDPSGRYDALVYGADYDCAKERTQLRSRTAILRGRTVRTDKGATVWVTPRPGSHEALALDLVCEYAARRPAPPAGGG
ncbi:MAG TPA: surface-adhesin E family protein [Longimicrobium sp.]|jgi:hypothetical protein